MGQSRGMSRSQERGRERHSYTNYHNDSLTRRFSRLSDRYVPTSHCNRARRQSTDWSQKTARSLDDTARHKQQNKQ